MSTFPTQQFWPGPFHTPEDRQASGTKVDTFLSNAEEASFIGPFPEKYWAASEEKGDRV